MVIHLREDATADSLLCAARGRHADRVPVLEPWMPPNGDTPSLQREGAKEMCHSTKRTHRFLAGFLLEVGMNAGVARETCERNRWVRFRKRTHRDGYFRGSRRGRLRCGACDV